MIGENTDKKQNINTDDRKSLKPVKLALLFLILITAGLLLYYGLQYYRAVKLYDSVSENVKEKDNGTVQESKAIDTEKETQSAAIVIAKPVHEMETAPVEYECETNADPENAVYSDPYYGYERNPAPDVPNFGVDFEKLKSINPDVVGWIYGCGGRIDYPVVLDKNEGFYLKHAIDGSRSSSGTIYVGYGHSGDLDQFVTPIFGHNMKNGSMFMPLLYYSGRGYWLSHPYFTFVKEDETRIYDIVSVMECLPNALPGYDSSAGAEGRQAFIDQIKAWSLYDTGVEVSTNDRLLMLITCRDHSSHRQVVIGRMRTDGE